MAADSVPEKLCPRWVQAQVLAALVLPDLALPVDKNKNFMQTENIKR